MGTETISYKGALVVNKCWCGIRHAVPQELDDLQARQHADGNQVTAIFCPLGHEYIPAGKGKASQLERELEFERNARAAITARADQAEASARAHKGHATRLRKRASAGTCPCCNRTFQQLARHMKTQHPEFPARGEQS
jgi:hypothetical protein